jgi:LAO/AO transport system kinase
MHELTTGVLAGEPLAMARAISLVENDPSEAAQLIHDLHSKIGKALRIGVTGPPGAGKSTLINEVAVSLRDSGEKIGIVAVDPSSPFTGGALLGDRVRMQKANEDFSIFIRSMASRGMPGGVAKGTADVADILDASGRTCVIVETVGVGQSEIEVTKLADVTLVVLSPESGDSIQAMKSGLMEAADIIVINKRDRPGADKLMSDIQGAFQLSTRRRDVPIVQTSAATAQGISDLITAARKYIESQKASGEFAARRRRIATERVKGIVEFFMRQTLWESADSQARLESAVNDVLEYRRSLYDAARALLKELTR